MAPPSQPRMSTAARHRRVGSGTPRSASRTTPWARRTRRASTSAMSTTVPPTPTVHSADHQSTPGMPVRPHGPDLTVAVAVSAAPRARDRWKTRGRPSPRRHTVTPMSVAVEGLVKHFRVHRRGAGLRASVGSVVRRRHVEVRAVDGISFSLAAGEVVGFLGRNGAGKTTTLKCLAGLLHPTAGRVRVLDHDPARREAAVPRPHRVRHGPAQLAVLGPARPRRVRGAPHRVPRPRATVSRNSRRARRPPRPRATAHQTGPCAEPRGADALRARRSPPAPTGGALPRRADARAGRQRPVGVRGPSCARTTSAPARPSC